MRNAFLLLSLALAACTGSDGEDVCDTAGSSLAAACACSEPTVEVGSGEMIFEEMPEGSPLTMVHGPQGGWHMLGSARFENFAPIVAVHYSIDVVATGARVSDNNYRVQMVEDGECTGFYPGMYGYLMVAEIATGELDTPPELLGGEEMLLTMTVEDADGRTASDTLTVIAALDPADEGGGDTGPDTVP
jgi:hypothetical protein